MDVDAAFSSLTTHAVTDFTRFYASDEIEAVLGAGCIIKRVRFPLFTPERMVFATIRTTVLVISHECDVSTENRRPFNEDVIVCPIIPLHNFVTRFREAYGSERLPAYVHNLATRRINRLVYIPPIPMHLDYGGVLFLNRISSTNVSCFFENEVEWVRVLSANGLREIDNAMEHQFLRPKQQMLPVAEMPWPVTYTWQ